MADSNSRDVTLRLLVDVLGVDGVAQLQQSLTALGKSGTESAAEAKALSDELDRLASQAGAIQGLQQLATQAEQLTEAETKAAATLDETRAALAAQRETVAAAAAAQRDAVSATQAARDALTDTNTALKTLRSGYSDVEKGTESYAVSLTQLIAQQGEQKKAIDAAKLAQADATKELNAAVSAQSKLETAQNNAAKAAQAAADAVEKQNSSIESAKAAAEALGVSTDNLAADQVRLRTSFADIATEANTLVTMSGRLNTALEEQAQAEAAAAAAATELEAAQSATRAQAFADAQGLLSTELQMVAESAQRAAAAQEEAAAAAQQLQAAESAEFTKQLATAQGLLDTELGLVAIAAEKASAAEREMAAAQAAAAAEVEAAAAAMAEAAQRSAQAIQDAYGTIGIRSVASLNEEIGQVRAAMNTLAASGTLTGQELQGAFTAGNARIAELEQQVRKATDSLTLADQAASLFKNSMGQLAAGNLIADAIGYLVNQVKELGREFLEVNVQAQTVTRGLTAIYGSAQTAASQLAFMKQTANEAGISFKGITEQFVQFSASTKTSGISLQQTNDIFKGVVGSAATLGLSTQRVTLILEALSQMASKGTVSMEELKRQLGDSLPGAMSLTAQSLGITTSELMKLVETGKLMAGDVLPAIGDAMAKLSAAGGENDTLAGSWARLKNAMDTFFTSLGDAGAIDVLTGAMKGLAAVVSVIVIPIEGFAEAVGLAGKAIGLFAGALSTGNFKQAMADFNQAVLESGERIGKLGDAFEVAITGQSKQAAATAAATPVIGTNTSALIANASAQAAATAGANATGNAYVQTLAKMAQNSAAIEENIAATNKLLKAKEEEGKTLIANAQLSGNAVTLLQAQVAAAQANVDASQKMVAAQQAEVTATQQAIDATKQHAIEQGRSNDEVNAATQALQAKLVAQQAALEKDTAVTENLKQQAIAAQTAADAYQDNSAKIGQYKAAMDSARETAQIYTTVVRVQTVALQALRDCQDGSAASTAKIKAAEDGLIATKRLLTAANQDAARNENLYRDAVNDSVKAIDLAARAKEAAMQVTLASVNAEKSHYTALAAEATAQGNTAAATYYTIQAKESEIKTIQLSVKIKNLELDAEKQEIQIREQALDQEDPLYEAKKKELDIELEIVKAKQIANNASLDQITALQQEINNLQLYGNAAGAATNSTNSNTNAANQNTDALNKQAAATKALTEQEQNLLRGRTKDGWAINTNGDKVVAQGDTALSAYNFLKSDGVDDDATAKAIAKEFADDSGNISDTRGMLKYGGTTISDALNRAAQQYVLYGKKVATQGKAATTADTTTSSSSTSTAAASSTSSSSTASSSSSSSGTTHYVNITLNGSTTAINTASAADATNLTNLLKSLSTAATTSS